MKETAFMTSPIGDLPINSGGLQTKQDLIFRTMVRERNYL